jgi:ABC-type Fe3+/spermidine/putrescine transport system ATPase subunit
MTTVSIRNLSRVYPGAASPALDTLSLDIASGELLALLGPSGCGKTTTIKMIAGLLPPSGGEILFDGRSILRDRPETRGAVMVFQRTLLFPYMSVAENVGFGLRMRKRPGEEIARRVGEMLARVRLPDLGQRRPSDLSGGQQQRVALARALIVQPDVLLLDEPLSSLDAHLRAEMRDLIRSLQRDLGITTIFVTHDQEEAVVLADRVALILDGRLCQHDVPQAFYQRPASEAVARFFGGRNFVRGMARDGVFHSDLGPLALPEGASPGPGTLTIRPEAIRIGAAAENAITMRVSDRVYLGAQTRLTLALGAVTLDAVLPPDAVECISQGDSIDIHLPRQSLWVLPGEAQTPL